MTHSPFTSSYSDRNVVSPGYSLPPPRGAKICNFYEVFNRIKDIGQLENAFRQMASEYTASQKINRHERRNRSTYSVEFDAIYQQIESFFLLECLHEDIKMEGQMVRIEPQGIIIFPEAGAMATLATLKSPLLKFDNFALDNSLVEDTRKNLTRHSSDMQEAFSPAELANAVLKVIFQALPDLYFRLQADGTILDYQANQYFHLYAPPENFLGKKIREVVPPDVASSCHEAIERVNLTNSLVTVEYSLPIRDRENSFEAKFIPFYDKEIIAIIRNLSDSKLAEETNVLLATVVERAADAIEITDAQARILYVNSAFEKITGYSRAEVLGKTPASLFRRGQYDEDFYEKIWETISSGQVWNGCLIGRRKDGELYHQEATISPVRNATGAIANYVALKRDISAQERSHEEREQSLSLLRATLESTADGIIVCQSDKKIVIYNQKFLKMWGIPESLMETRILDRILPLILEQVKNCEAVFRQTQYLFDKPEIEAHDIIELKDGRIFERYSLPQRIGGKIVGRVCNFRDITERKRAEEKIRYQALHDLLTDLPNRTLFDERLSVALSKAKKEGGKLAVCFLDLDRFKTINDTLGHAVGDRLLQCVAQRLTNCLRAGDTVSRWGGDEFTILLPTISSQENAAAVAQRLLETFKRAFNIEKHHLHVSSSIGIALYPQDGEDAETLLKNADAALYRVKAQSRNAYQFYTSLMTSEATELLALENSLHHALEKEEFVIHYQPLVNVNTGQIIQMEALVRWQHPRLGLIYPEKFISLAEENGSIVPINEWVLRTACAQNKAWQDSGLAKIGVAVNLSARQFQHPNFLEKVALILKQTGLAPEWLELEITESIAMQREEITKTTLKNLHQMGVGIALDDFGTGYSSLSYLKKFPLHTLKIDRSFVEELTTNSKDTAIVTAIITLGKGLNIKVVAEGVETEKQRNLLESIQCEIMQGYLFSKPLSAAAATQLLDRARCGQISNSLVA